MIRIRRFQALALTVNILALNGLQAGLMDPAIGVETYRDFAENRGRFQPGAENVPVYKKDSGELVGKVPHVPNFDAVIDAGWAALIAHPGFLATVAHNNSTTVTFARRFGADTEPFLEEYTFTNYNRAEFDFAVPRLSKLVTEATPINIFMPKSGRMDSAFEKRLREQNAVRIGAGTQDYATDQGKSEKITGAYRFLTAGTVDWVGSEEGKSPFTLNANPESFSLRLQSRAADEVSPLHITGRGGDSGSPALTYNSERQQFEFIGAYTSSYHAVGFGQAGWVMGHPLWHVKTIESYESRIQVAPHWPVLWEADASGKGNFMQAGRSIASFQGLSHDVHGATATASANGTEAPASPEQLDATNNLVFTGADSTVTLSKPLDMGAGSLTFYVNTLLTGARLNSAGKIIQGGVTVTSQLQAREGDEWRVIGPGTLVISGRGENPARLNCGGGGLTVLRRSEGSAASRVKLNGGPSTTVRLESPGQLAGGNGGAGTVIFGFRGGTLDLYGQSASWEGITHLDRGARISNTNPQAISTFTFAGKGEHVYLGGFEDGGRRTRGVLNVVYDGGEGSTWTLHGDITNQGTWSVASGTVKITGRPTPLAAGRFDNEKWEWATLDTGVVMIQDGATVILGKGANVASDFYIEPGGSLILESSFLNFTGRVLAKAPTSAAHPIPSAVPASEALHE